MPQHILYSIGFVVSLLCLREDQQIDSVSKISKSDDTMGKSVKLSNHAKFASFLLTQKLFSTAFRSLFPLFLIDKHVIPPEYVAAVTATIPLIASTLGSAFGGLLPSIIGAGLPIGTQLFGQTLIMTIFAVPSYLIFAEPSWLKPYLLLFSSLMISLLSFLGGAQTTLVFVKMADIVKANEYKENKNQLYCWMCSLEIIGKLACGIFIGSIADYCGYGNTILLCLVFQIFTVFIV